MTIVTQMKLTFNESHQLVYTECFDGSEIGNVMGFLMIEGLVEDEVGARTMVQSMSREWFDQLSGLAESAKGKLGAGTADNMGGARAAGGGGRLGVFTPARGIGADKRHKNNTKGDDARIRTYNKQARADRKADAKERSERGEDKYSKAIKKVQEG